LVSKQRFCSHSCYWKWLHEFGPHGDELPWSKAKVTIICKYCGKETQVRPSWRKKIFCNSTCYAKWLSEEIRGKKHHNWKPKVQKICLICGKSFETHFAYQNRRKFCSFSCYHKWISLNVRGERHPNWNNGSSFEPYSPEFNKQLKELIRMRDGYACRKCGRLEILGPKKLCIHHIDYDKKNSLPDNLITLCDRCNKQVNFNRKKWTIYFQQKIKRRWVV